MPRAGHIRAWPLRKMLQAGPSVRSPDALHLCKLRRLVSVATTRRALLLIVLPTARTLRCSVCERSFVKRHRLTAAASIHQTRHRNRLRCLGLRIDDVAAGAGSARTARRIPCRTSLCWNDPNHFSKIDERHRCTVRIDNSGAGAPN
jgi:hypothetical protein